MAISDAFKVFSSAFLEAINPPPIITVSEWADKNRMLPSKTSSEPGMWRTERTPYLREIMDELSHMSKTKEVVFMKGAQVGAPLKLDTLVPTLDGFKEIKDISIGDIVFDENGKQQSVLGVSDVFKNESCYIITFDDNSQVECDGRHLWTLERDNFKGDFKQVTKQTSELIKDFKRGVRNRYRLKLCPGIDFSKKDLLIGPYTLGAWLADGNKHSNRITSFVDDAESIASEILKDGHRVDVVQDEKRYDTTRTIVIDPVAGHKGIRPDQKFGYKLRKLGVHKNKHIPIEYLRSSRKQRVRLLQGLMDSDGCCTKDGLSEYYSTIKELAYQVYHLLATLGIKARISRKPVISKNEKSTFNSKLDVWVVRFTTYSDFKVFSLNRKQKRLKADGRKNETGYRRIKDIKEVPGFETKCIKVSSKNNLFLIGRECIPTHNTESGNNWLGYIIDYMPATVMVVWPALPDVKKNSKLRIDPLIENTPCLHGKISYGKNKDKSNTAMFKDFDGGALILSGANSASSLRSVPAKFLFLDEIDGYPDDVEGEGDPIALVQARARTFPRRKIFKISTPTIKGRSKIEKEFRKSDQRYYHVPCPHCHIKQKLDFKNLQYDTMAADEGKIVTYAAFYCINCGEEIQEHNKTWMLSSGEWIKENPDSNVAGFHLSALYSPLGWFSWKEIAQDWVNAQGNFEMLMAFHNTVLGETYEDKGDKPEHDALYERRELYDIGTVPRGVLFLTCAVDVQKDRLEAEVIGWGRFKERWSIDHKVIPGDVQDTATWDNLEDYIRTSFPHADGYQVGIKMVGIDSGYETQRVYNFCRKFNPRHVVPLKGEMNQYQVVSTPKAVDVKESGKINRRGLKLWKVGTNMIKSEIYGDLKKQAPDDFLEGYPPGFIHFPQYDMEYFLQLTAEERTIQRDSRGFTKVIWQKKRERNEILDLHVYNRALASIIGIDRMNEDHYKKLELNIGIATITKKEDTETKARSSSKRERKNRGSSWL